MRILAGLIAIGLALGGASSARLAAQDPAAVMVVLETEKGTIEIEVNPAKAPITAANFLKYVDEGFYDGGRFHRAVRPNTENRTDYPIQVIQASVNPARAREGFGTIALERTNMTGLLHKNGVVSMARGNTADTASNQFFICIGDQPELDFGGRRNADGQGFGAFGRVIIGMDVVEKIQTSPVAKDRQDPAILSQSLSPPILITKARRKT
ncbi:MAG TPA: peptidylprolyl isomerase [Vicinamibacterales bacterium]|jgi:peptidyl-prolyl cis-trans isomerase A (cyclophilin A)